MVTLDLAIIDPLKHMRKPFHLPSQCHILYIPSSGMMMDATQVFFNTKYTFSWQTLKESQDLKTCVI